MSNNPEVFKGNTETGIEAQSAAAERSAELAKKLEKGVEASPEKQAEALDRARNDAKEALMGKERGGAEKRGGGEPTASGVRKATKKQKDAEYKKTLKSIQSKMDSSSRTFSKVIHNPAVEKTSEVAGKTIARPNALLAGSTAAFFLVAGTYLIAKQYGYVLSGFETIAAFVVGWIIGIIFDYVRVMVKGGRSN